MSDLGRRQFLSLAVAAGTLASAGFVSAYDNPVTTEEALLLPSARTIFQSFIGAQEGAVLSLRDSLEAMCLPARCIDAWMYRCTAGVAVVGRRDSCAMPTEEAIRSVTNQSVSCTQLAARIGLQSRVDSRMTLHAPRIRVISRVAEWRMVVALADPDRSGPQTRESLHLAIRSTV